MDDHWQYLIVMAGCLLITAPLEFVGGGVYRRPIRVLRAVLPVAAVFLLWDGFAIAANVWTYNERYITGRTLPFRIPLEELIFFLVIPICAILTYVAVQAIVDRRSMTKRLSGQNT
ncbi:lycopene cyclase domain-containing protein [Antrihabitans cavernicola]|uniref:Lycopene cyclase domain-containing protein n=1 Tax=Antrihabitans cavernicola TaxID=2495913 RepID=A0A5A7SCC8_9NOCA|nr:lycopene cyclase domain-containing protein [Spelaeibacter cavernicola]KAA0022397.1 lycopene cyclase domain-containing protein [Spelaeibacter cavernicola]